MHVELDSGILVICLVQLPFLLCSVHASIKRLTGRILSQFDSEEITFIVSK